MTYGKVTLLRPNTNQINEVGPVRGDVERLPNFVLEGADPRGFPFETTDSHTDKTENLPSYLIVEGGNTLILAESESFVTSRRHLEALLQTQTK